MNEIGYRPPVPLLYECDLVLQENGDESRQPRSFMEEPSPGTHIRIEDRDWIVVVVREGDGERPEVVCRPANERP